MKKWAFVLALGLLSTVAITYLCSKKPDFDPVKYIEGKVAKENVAPGFYPVLIFQVKSLGGKVQPVTSASGTAFIGKSGKWKVVTAGHVFSKEYQNCFYVFRRLRPYENAASMGVSSVVQINGDVFDVAECTVGEPQKISGFSSVGGTSAENRRLNDSYRTLKDANISGIKSFVLISVVSGEHATIYAISEKNYGNTFHWIIGYHNIPGESGTGFVDENRWLYVLSGSLPSDAIPKEWRDKLKIPESEKELSIISGPFEVLPK